MERVVAYHRLQNVPFGGLREGSREYGKGSDRVVFSVEECELDCLIQFSYLCLIYKCNFAQSTDSKVYTMNEPPKLCLIEYISIDSN